MSVFLFPKEGTMTKKISKKNVSDVSKDSNANKAEKPETFEMSEASIDLFHDPDNVAYVTYKFGNIDELDQFLNLEECDRILFLSVLLAAFRFGKPTPITLITGEHGSGKTTLARIFRRLTDPSVAPVQTASGNERDLQIACSN